MFSSDFSVLFGRCHFQNLGLCLEVTAVPVVLVLLALLVVPTALARLPSMFGFWVFDYA